MSQRFQVIKVTRVNLQTANILIGISPKKEKGGGNFDT